MAVMKSMNVALTSYASVFPPTTTAATTSLETGLNPFEHVWLGLTIYINELNNIYTLFLNSQKEKIIKMIILLKLKKNI